MATPPEAEAAVCECLEDLYGLPPATYTDAITGRTTVAIYCAECNDSTAAKRRELAARLSRIRATGLRLGPGRISVTRLRRENWAQSWKRHFKPLEIGAALLIKPSWSRRRPRSGQAVVVLDPGLSFGTGQHPTTAFCLRQIVARRKLGSPQAFLDLGAGSGILAIAAAKLGYAPVHAFDFDPEACRAARANARQNCLARTIRVCREDLTRLPLRSNSSYDVVCANLISPLLVRERERIMNRVKPGGILVAAGILKSEFADVQHAYEEAGMRLLAGRSEKEWRSGVFEVAGRSGDDGDRASTPRVGRDRRTG